MSFGLGLSNLSDRDRGRLLALSAASTALIAVVDFVVQPNVSLGYLYIIPILIGSVFLARWQIVAFAALCALLREELGPATSDGLVWTREIMVFGAFLSSGLLLRQIRDGHWQSAEYSRQLEDRITLQHEAEEQLRIFVESNPAAILTVDQNHRILRVNAAAGRMFGCSSEDLLSRRVDEFLPDLKRVPIEAGKRFVRTNMECTGWRSDGSLLATDVWFSTYVTSSGPRLAAIVLDLTEQLREREDLNLDSLLATSRVLVGAVLHEIRNLSAAATVAHANLRREPLMADSEDFQALGVLVANLEQVASSELALLTDREDASVDLCGVLREFQLVVEPSVKEINGSLVVHAPDKLRVRIDRYSLVQVLLNLARNSIRALRGSKVREIAVIAEEEDIVLLRFRDSGPGVKDTDGLFQPFRTSAEATGLGLYVSRALVRSFGGELYHEPSSMGAEFVVRMLKAPTQGGEAQHAHHGAQHQSADHRRPQSVPSRSEAAT